MFGISDLLTVCVLEEAFEFLAKNPHHLEFVLCAMVTNKRLSDKVGLEHIKDCIDFVTQNKIQISTYYEADQEKIPSITVVGSGGESQKYLGETGVDIVTEVNRPVVYAEFMADSVSGDGMTVNGAYGLAGKLWPGLILMNDDKTVPAVKILGLIDEPGQTVICLTAPLPDGSPLSGWKAMSSGSFKKYHLAGSTDDSRIQCKLTTSGDLSIHRLLSIALRWALKRYRLRFDEYGMQEMTFSYTPPVVVDQDQHIYESVYTLDVKYTDHWIDKEYDTLPEGVNFATRATATNVSEEKEDVTLD